MNKIPSLLTSISGEYINNKERYCLWLVGANPAEISKMPEVMKRIELCRQDRLNGADDRKKLAEKPMLFRETKNPSTYIIVPATSSDKQLEPLFKSFTIPGAITNEQLATLVTKDAAGNITDQFTITVVAHAIQADGFDTADLAWGGFEEQYS